MDTCNACGAAFSSHQATVTPDATAPTLCLIFAFFPGDRRLGAPVCAADHLRRPAAAQLPVDPPVLQAAQAGLGHSRHPGCACVCIRWLHFWVHNMRVLSHGTAGGAADNDRRMGVVCVCSPGDTRPPCCVVLGWDVAHKFFNHVTLRSAPRLAS